jgi:hypothetical protein
VARPRDAQTLTSPEFVATRSHCLDVFTREVRRGGGPSIGHAA